MAGLVMILVFLLLTIAPPLVLLAPIKPRSRRKETQ
jgi:hypothetical protein